MADASLDKLLPDSPLCQAMELVLGRTAGSITLADLQTVTGLSIGRRDTLTGAQEIGVAFDEAGEEFTTVTVEYTGAGSGAGLHPVRHGAGGGPARRTGARTGTAPERRILCKLRSAAVRG